LKYGNTLALENVHFEIPRGACCAVVGPNGSGKSTLFKCALGLLKPAHGSVAVFGGLYSPQVHRVAYIPQRSEVDWDFPATVFDAVLMGAKTIPPVWSRSRNMIFEQVFDYLDRVGMKHLSQRPLNQLSGGQQQRVFFARALLQQADLYLMDEPFSGVDAKTEDDLCYVLRNLCDSGKTVIVIHHNIQTVPRIFNHVLLLNGTVVACGTIANAWSAANISKAYAPREERNAFARTYSIELTGGASHAR
jgi:manganese/zinc/iron transport system ATP- binding protein